MSENKGAQVMGLIVIGEVRGGKPNGPEDPEPATAGRPAIARAASDRRGCRRRTPLLGLTEDATHRWMKGVKMASIRRRFNWSPDMTEEILRDGVQRELARIRGKAA